MTANPIATFISRSPSALYAPIRFAAAEFELDTLILVDTGASHTIIDRTTFPEQFRKFLRQSAFSTVGVGNVRVPADGEFTARIDMGGGYFKDCRVYVGDTKAPPLLGRDILHGPTVRSSKYPGPPERSPL